MLQRSENFVLLSIVVLLSGSSDCWWSCCRKCVFLEVVVRIFWMLSEYSDTFCLVLILVMSFPDICTVVITLSEFIDFFPKLWKFLIPGVLISECSDFDSSCWQNFLIPNCYQHVLILVTFLAAGVYVRSFWLLSEYVQSFCMSAACFFSYHDTSLVELVSGSSNFFRTFRLLALEFSDCCMLPGFSWLLSKLSHC